jgi:predicted dehydrogenase
MKKMKVGIIGTGNLAELHMKAYRKNPDVEIVAVCDFNLERAKQRAEQFGAKEVYQDYKDMLSKSDIDAVSVITWNNTHAEITVNALNAGKHVLCEKPPALNALQALAYTISATNLKRPSGNRRENTLPCIESQKPRSYC